jgi:colanic acid biosynthesis glycosyl transferase WcaI
LRILIQDFSGHPFQVQLSRSLAANGHEVTHTYCPDYTSGQGALERRPDDPPNFVVEGIELGGTFAKYQLSRRLLQEMRYGLRLARYVRKHKPDVFVSCNEPLFSKAVLGLSCLATRQRWVFWLQDLYSVAMRRELASRAGRAGDLAGRLLVRLESWLLKRASAVVVITPAFADWMEERGIRQPEVHVIPNWAPLDELPYFEDDQGWFTSIGVPAGAPVALYSGTLGLKHNADALLRVATRLDEVGGHVVVVSQGPAADELAGQQAGHPNLHVLPFQPWSEVPKVFGSATVLLAVLEADAGAFSVPSKILTYLCAGRPVVASMPAENLASKLIEGGEAGTITPPSEAEPLAQAALRFCDDRALADLTGKAARATAERSFAIGPITDRFSQVLEAARG